MLKNILTFLLSIIFSLLLCEFIASVAGYDGYSLTFSKIVYRQDFQCANTEAICEEVSSREWLTESDYFEKNSHIKIDGQLIPKKKPRGVKRILLLGDSATFGQGVMRVATFARRIERELPKGWEVINAGVPGLDNVDELVLLKNKLSQLSPDLIVWQIFMSNDLNFNISGAIEERLMPNKRHAVIYRSAFVKMCFLGLMRLGLSPSRFFDEVRPNETSSIDQNGLNYLNYAEGEYALYHKEPSSLEAMVYSTFSEVSKEILKVANAIDAKLLVLLVPSRSAILRDLRIIPDLPKAKDVFGKSDEFYKTQLDYRRPHKRVISILKKLGIEFYDPLAKDSLDESFFAGWDDHPGVAGHRLYADEIMRNIKNNYNLNP